MRVLCLDIEGGFGGSSRSLYESVRHLHTKAEIEVWCRKEGPIQPRYEALGVPCRVTPAMPHISSLPRFSRNLYAFTRFALNWRASAPFRAELRAAARRGFDVIHCNHEGLFLLLRWLRRQQGTKAALTAHVRTHLPKSPVFPYWQYRTLAENADWLVFITENEQKRVGVFAGRPVDGSVIYNIVSPPEGNIAPRADLASDDRLKIAVLSNYAWIRGIDRLIDVAAALSARGRNDILFVMAGNMKLSGTLPGALRAIADAGGDLADYARDRGVGHMFSFLGHVSDPESVLAACDALAKPTREANPWGRDILEAMAYGLPPITLGTYGTFVEHGVTGILHAEFDAQAWADEITRLADDRALCRTLGTAAADRVRDLCGGQSRATDLLNVWRRAAKMESDSCAA